MSLQSTVVGQVATAAADEADGGWRPGRASGLVVPRLVVLVLQQMEDLSIYF